MNLFYFAVKYISPSNLTGHNFTYYWIEKSTTKAISFVEKIDNMLQRQIVNGLGKQIEDALYIKYTIRCFHYIDWMFIPVNVTIDRTVPIQTYRRSSHCMMMNMTKLRRCI